MQRGLLSRMSKAHRGSHWLTSSTPGDREQGVPGQGEAGQGETGQGVSGQGDLWRVLQVREKP